jgi:Family of unknown function (DUF5946)
MSRQTQTPRDRDSKVSIEECLWCKGKFSADDGPTHVYMESTPGCWACYGRVLAREYEDQRFLPVHRLTVDAYAVQHPGKPNRQTIQSVGVHLVRLCLFLEHGLSPERANDAMLVAAKHKARYRWLEPPASLGKLTVADVEAAIGVEEHLSVVRSWATQMWQVWSPHHSTVRAWADAA